MPLWPDNFLSALFKIGPTALVIWSHFTWQKGSSNTDVNTSFPIQYTPSLNDQESYIDVSHAGTAKFAWATSKCGQ